MGNTVREIIRKGVPEKLKAGIVKKFSYLYVFFFYHINILIIKNLFLYIKIKI